MPCYPKIFKLFMIFPSLKQIPAAFVGTVCIHTVCHDVYKEHKNFLLRF